MVLRNNLVPAPASLQNIPVMVQEKSLVPQSKKKADNLGLIDQDCPN
jgi:hypothetical protein